LVARQHSNGNITSGLYLVDLACLGIKDTNWHFNMPISEYRDYIDKFSEFEAGVEKIDYVLAHNIVHAGIDFADDYAFKPHKDFTSVTQFILDEDTDDIPIIEIECGLDGLPAYMPGPLHSDSKAKQVIAQLEKVAGPGNYFLIDENGMVIEDSDEDFDDDFDPFEEMDLDEKKRIFLKDIQKIGEMEHEEANKFFDLCQSIINDIIDYNIFSEYIVDLDGELSEIQVTENSIPDQMLGNEPDSPPIPNKVKKQFLEILMQSLGVVKISKLIKKFGEYTNVDAANAYLQIIQAELEQSKKYETLLKSAAQKYPNYGLITLRLAETKIIAKKTTDNQPISYKYNDFFQGREEIHQYEYFSYLHFRIIALNSENKLEKLEAWKRILPSYVHNINDLSMLIGLINMHQIQQIANLLT
jgi:hypothetical protein